MVRLIWVFLFTYILLIIQSTIITEVFPLFMKPDLMLLWVIYLSVTIPLFPGLFFVAWGGFLYDTFSGSPFGLFLFLYLGIFLLIKLMGRFLIMGESTRFRSSLVAMGVAFQALGIVFLLWVLGISEHLIVVPFWHIVVSGGITCGLVWPFFRLGERIRLRLREAPAKPIL